MSFPEPVGQREEVPDVKAMLARMVELGGSDLCLKVGNRPLVRIDGKLRWLDDDSHELEPHETMEMLHAVLPDVRLKEFENEHEVDFAYSVPTSRAFASTPSSSAGRCRSCSVSFRLR